LIVDLPNGAKGILRGWKPGDRFHRRGESRPKPLKSFFPEMEVPAWDRPTWPVIQSGEKIVWARGLLLAADAETGWEVEDVQTP